MTHGRPLLKAEGRRSDEDAMAIRESVSEGD
jgi:hypothetical protein